MGFRNFINAHRGVIQGVSLLLIAAALFVAARRLPLADMIEQVRNRVVDLGTLGHVAFGAGYVVAALLFIPGSLLTLAAGAFFGLVGVITVSLASTTAAALAFLIARYLAREKVAEAARRHPRFGAVDRAIAEGGWRIVALLRLSPVIPYSAGNYLFGLTRLRFWPYVLASWIAMLPGTFLYVYLGQIGRLGVQAVGEEVPETTTGEWVLRIVGLLATAAVTVYLTRLARRRLREAPAIAAEMPEEGAVPAPARRPGTPWGVVATALVALLLTACAGMLMVTPGLASGLFGPPSVELQEAYAPKEGGATVDHGIWDGLLGSHVSKKGLVDYKGFKKDRDELDRYLKVVAEAPFDALGRDEKLALLINAYNAFTVRLILKHMPVASIKDIEQPWKGPEWTVGGHRWTLWEIEHEQCRAKFKEPRIHFALNCASLGCPPLRQEAYVAARLEKQLEDQARYVHAGKRWFRFDPGEGVAHLTELYKWYAGDFKQVAGSVLDYVARYVPRLKSHLDEDQEVEVRWITWDWSLNDQAPDGRR